VATVPVPAPVIDWSASVLLVSGFDDEGSGGLFTFDGSELGQIDSLSSVGLVVRGARVGRLLRAPVDVDSATELVVYDRTGVLEYRRIDAVVDPHDLAVFEGKWIIVSSGANSVTALAPDGAADVMWQPSTVPDSWHPNCVAVVDGRVWVTAFGRFDDPRGWSGDASFNAGFLRNLATGEEIGGLSHPHSPRWTAGTWTVCNSLERTVVTWDPDAARWRRRVELARYPRGLVVDGRTLYVGESANRGDPDERASLAIVQDDRVVDRVPLPSREVYDVVVAPRAALDGLRRGFNTNPHRVAAATGDDLLGAVGSRKLFAGIGYPVDTSVASTAVTCRPPTSAARSSVVTLDVEVTNLSEVALASVPPYPVCLSYRWRAADGVETDGPRTRLGRVLLRDDAASYTIDLEVPPDAGTYQLTVCLVQEGYVWFDGFGPSNASVTTVAVT
jgi:hypothetical protein